MHEKSPEQRFRQGSDEGFEHGSLTPLSSPIDDSGSGSTTANKKLSATNKESKSTVMPLKNNSLPNPKKVVRRGRPRLYSARIIEETDDSFIVRIKFNIRNKLARRLFGISVPLPPQMEILSRLRPPLIRSVSSKDFFFENETVSGEKRTKRHTSQRQNGTSVNVQNEFTTSNASGGDIDLETHRPIKNISSDHSLVRETAEILWGRFEKNIPFHGVLPLPQCIINETDPTAYDRKMFNKFSSQAAENNDNVQCQILIELPDKNSPSTTPIPQSASHYYSRSQIEKLQFRDYLIDTWYSSPYPEEHAKNKVLHMCEFCLKYMSSAHSCLRHQLKSCISFKNHPPGTEIYRDSDARISFWEVDGRKNIEYCQSLCLLAKLFLNSKTLYYDVEPFVFYILTEIDDEDPYTYHFVGYFSKEKLNNSDYNVSCILTLPIYQRKGYGSLMIDFSYLLSRREFKYGTPEKPLSDLGLVSYRNYWKVAVARALRRLHDNILSKYSILVRITLENIAQLTGMKPSDIVFALEQLDALLKSDETGGYAIIIDLKQVNDVISKWDSRRYVKIYPEFLLWKPLIYGPSGGINSSPALPFVPHPGPQPSPISNSISMITEFLKDDINNPSSFEEEAYKSIKGVIESRGLKEPSMKPHGYHTCQPDSNIRSPPKSIPRVSDVKLASADGEEETEAERSVFGSDFQEFSDAEDGVGNYTHVIESKLGALAQESEISLNSQEQHLSGADGESDDDNDRHSSDDENSDKNVLKNEEQTEVNEPVIFTCFIQAQELPRKTRSKRKFVRCGLFKKDK